MSYYNETLIILSGLCAILTYLTLNEKKSLTTNSKNNNDNKNNENIKAFYNFRRNYLIVYFFVTAGDWIQGPYLYTSYKNHGFDLNQIAILFVTGFLASGIFGIIIGSAADKYGRKKFCLVYALLYSTSCLIIVLFSNFYILLFGRVLGGISTSLLFSVFEAWMISEHFSRGFDSNLLSDTFSYMTFGNGFVAIICGLLAGGLEKNYGILSPFIMAICFFIVAALMIIINWNENFGKMVEQNHSSRSLISSLYYAIIIIKNDSFVLVLGVVQSLFEASMYIFVFLWGPLLEIQHKSNFNFYSKEELLPFGLIFSSFMVAIMIGSLIYDYISGPKNISLSTISHFNFLIASISLLISTFIKDELLLFFFFLIFEFTCGIYFPLIGTLRAKVVPKNLHATIGNLFRVPLNLIVVTIL
ncbi:8707_t:CDS:2, partial [Diversispora eburnea]